MGDSNEPETTTTTTTDSGIKEGDGTPGLSDLERHAVELAKLAIHFDSIENLAAASYYYQECVTVLFWLGERGSKLLDLKTKLATYIDRAEVIQSKIKSKEEEEARLRHQQHLLQVLHHQREAGGRMERDLKRAKFLLMEAMDEDEGNHLQEALSLYLDAAELCIQTKDKAGCSDEVKHQLSSLADKALSRAEEIRKVVNEDEKKKKKDDEDYDNILADVDEAMIRDFTSKFQLDCLNNDDSVPASSSPSTLNTSIKPGTSSSSSASPIRVLPSSTSSSTSRGGPIVPHQQGDSSLNKNMTTRKGLVILGPQGYTRQEIQVLKTTSTINGREFVPFLSIDLKERFAFPLPFSDRHGPLKLSDKQKSRLHEWVRLDVLHPNPKIFNLRDIDPFSIRQTIVSDCSFLSSLMVSALHEKRWKKKLISNIIYPQDRSGNPVYNPCGKYMVRLNVNGIRRKVIIDDTLPVDRHGSLLCSYSSASDEFWVSLLEKAYLKVMGGYDFPGSNSNIDLHSLTGWIPQRIGIRDGDFDQDKVFNLLKDRLARGQVLITVATGDMSQALEEKTGLVSTHAYAVFDVRLVLGKKLLLIKNPWSHLRWKGRFSERDTLSWTPALKQALSYDPMNAKQFDDGVFYMDFASVCQFFEAIYLNWDPTLFKYTFSTHDMWHAGVGPAKDVYNIGHNPQYCLSLNQDNCSVWILLTRHITDRDDFAHNREYIALMVYDQSGGKRVHVPFDPPPLIDGARINSPHYLCKIIIPATKSTTTTDNKQQSSKYTLVMSQYEKSTTIYYTLRAYSTVPFNLTKIVDPYDRKEKITGEWTRETAGGCANNRSTYHNNPVYQIRVHGAVNNPELNHVMIDLKGPKQFAVGFDVKTVSVDDPNTPYLLDHLSSGSFRPGFTVLEVNPIPSGIFNITPSTFHPGQVGPFFLTVHSNCSVSIARIK